MGRRTFRLLTSFGGVAIVTFLGYRTIPVNATTEGFAYLLLVLIIASTWGFLEAALSSVLAALAFNFFFFPPVGTFTIEDPQNWVALISFLAASLIASRLSAIAKRRALEAIERKQDVERLYSFSRGILLIDGSDPFPGQLIAKLAGIFALRAATLYECRTRELYRNGSIEIERVEDRLREAASQGSSWADAERNQMIVPVRLGSEVIATLALEGGQMSESAVEGIVSLVATGMERARAQHLAQEAAHQNEQLRTAIIDAMAHEFKTPLTTIRGATTALLANPDGPLARRIERLTIADEEAEHLRELIDNAVELARLDIKQIDVHPEPYDLREVIREVVASMRSEIDERQLDVVCDEQLPMVSFDPRLMKLAIKQLLDNALKYSPPDTPVAIRAHADSMLTIEVTDYGAGLSAEEQMRIFERFYRSPSFKHQIPGSGLGLSIAHRIVRAHNGDLTVTSRPGETTFRMTLPTSLRGDNR